jgi:type II pantothenate kinase
MLMINKIGIDAGGTLVKVVYQEDDKLHHKVYPIAQLDSVVGWLKRLSPSARMALTGGKAQYLQKNFFSNAIVVPEFNAAVNGARYLLMEEGTTLHNYLLVNIGTGTSWFLINEEKKERILGSGIGGGTFTGLGELLTGENDFYELVKLASKGNKSKVNLTVSDIYMGGETPVEGNLTASNFAKGRMDNQTKEDLMSAVTSMIAETIVLLSIQAATIHKSQHVVFMGSTFTSNEPLKRVLESYKGMHGMNTLFLKNGQYSGALGALIAL